MKNDEINANWWIFCSNCESRGDGITLKFLDMIFCSFVSVIIYTYTVYVSIGVYKVVNRERMGVRLL